MFDRLEELERELERLESEQVSLFSSGDQDAAIAAGRRIAELAPVVGVFRQHRDVTGEMADANELANAETDPAMLAFLREEMAEKEAALVELEAELKELLVPRDPTTARTSSSRSAAPRAGDEANLWAGDLFRMYDALRRPARLEDRDAVEPAVGHGRLPRDHRGREG